MNNDRKRAARRRNNARALAHAVEVCRLQAGGVGELSELRARKNRDHLAKCSCQMCRNPRRSKLAKGRGKLTIQELRAEVAGCEVDVSELSRDEE